MALFFNVRSVSLLSRIFCGVCILNLFKYIKLLLACAALIVVTSCNDIRNITEPIDLAGQIENTKSLNSAYATKLNGVYRITDGNEYFGDYAVVKFTRNHLSIFCEKNTAYFILSSGEKDSTILFNGFWRFGEALTSGNAELSIKKNEGYSQIISGQDNNSKIIISGNFKKENGTDGIIRIEYLAKLKDDSTFYSIAHRGGGRNSDGLQASENSLEILQLAEYYGANAVEVDIQLTKDKVPILFHDEEFSQRLIKGNYLIGSVSSFSFQQIRTFGRLIHDEKIPALEEALDIILNKTNLKLVWLDVKLPEAVSLISPIQKKYIELATKQGRELKILIGLPSTEVVDEYLKNSTDAQQQSICELDINVVRTTNSFAWAPRWTDGIIKSQVNSVHTENRKVFVWTLDIQSIVHDFIYKGYFDGVLTNYPSLVSFEYYTGDVQR